MKPLFSLVVSSLFPSTQPTIPVLSEASDRDMNVIFPLVFLTAVLNSYETLKAPWLLPDGSLLQSYLWESLERASLLPWKRNSCFLSYTIYLTRSPSQPFSFALWCICGFDEGKCPRLPLIHKNLMKLGGKVHKNLITSSPPDIGYKSNLEALLRIGVITINKHVSGKSLPLQDVLTGCLVHVMLTAE